MPDWNKLTQILATLQNVGRAVGQGNAPIDFSDPRQPPRVSPAAGYQWTFDPTVQSGGASGYGSWVQVRAPSSGDGGGGDTFSSVTNARANMLAALSNAMRNTQSGWADQQTLEQNAAQQTAKNRSDALALALQAAPYAVAPGTRYAPGYEPFGPAQQLARMLGVNVPLREMQTQTLPLSALYNAPVAMPSAPPQGIDPRVLQLAGLLGA